MIKFYAKGAELVRVPGAAPRPNQPDMYVGRYHDPTRRAYPATPEPYEVDENTDAGRRLISLARVDNSLYAADENTAKICGIEFIDVEYKDGAFIPKPPKKNSTKEV